MPSPKDVLTPVIMTTTYSNQEMLLDAINLNTTRYLHKPLKNNDLLDALYIGVKKFLTADQLIPF